MPTQKADQRLAKQFPTYIRFVLKQQWVKKWQHFAMLLFPIAFYVLLICLKSLLIWMTESPIPLSFVDKLLSMLQIPFAPNKAQKQYLPYKITDPLWNSVQLTEMYPNSGSYEYLNGADYLDVASYQIGYDAAIAGPLEMINARQLNAKLYYRDVPVRTENGKTLQDNSITSLIGILYDQWQNTYAADKLKITFKSIGWIDIPDVDYITRGLVNDSAYLLFIFINHILLPLTVVDMVTQRTTGFMNMLQVSGMKATVFYVANFIFYYILAVILGLVNYIAAAAFGLTIRNYPVRVLIITMFFPFFELPLSFLIAFCFNSVFTASVVMWFGIVLIPQMLMLIANAFSIRKNFLAWILPSASISYINSKNPEMLEKMSLITGVIVAQSLILFGIAITAIAIRNYGKQMLTKHRDKRAAQTFTVASDAVLDVEPNVEESPIDICQITKQFGKSKTNAFTALEGVTFSVGKNEIKGLIGHNGSGKTTLMNIITKTTRPTSGRFNVRGFLCYCPQMDCLPGDFIAKDIIQLFSELRVRDGNTQEMCAETLVSVLHISSSLTQKIKTCSYGDRRKIQLVCAAVNALPEDIILLDEVTTNLSRNDAAGVWDILRHFKRSASSVLFISHDLSEITSLCDRVVMLKKGRIALHADPKNAARDAEYDAVEVLEPESSKNSIEMLGYQHIAITGNFRRFVIPGKVQDMRKDVLDVLQRNGSVLKSADLETVFSRVEALE